MVTKGASMMTWVAVAVSAALARKMTREIPGASNSRTIGSGCGGVVAHAPRRTVKSPPRIVRFMECARQPLPPHAQRPERFGAAHGQATGLMTISAPSGKFEIWCWTEPHAPKCSRMGNTIRLSAL